MRLTLRPARTEELAEIARLMNLAFRGVGPEISWCVEAGLIDGDRTSEALLREELAAKPRGVFLVIESPSRASLAGCVWLEATSEQTWYMGSLTVDPSLQNAGLGRELLTAAEQWAIERGASHMHMHVVDARDTLIAWYERRGYHRTGETHPFPYGDTRFGTPQRADLTFVVLGKCLASSVPRTADDLKLQVSSR